MSVFDDDQQHVSPFDEPIEDLGFDEEPDLGQEPEDEPDSNKTFLIAVAGLIGFLVVAMALLAIYAVFIMPSKRRAQETQVAQINAQNTAIAQGLTATAQAAAWTPTSPPVPTATPTPITAAAVVTPTPVVVLATSTSTPAIDPTAFALTATAIYATNVAAWALTPSPTALATTGFADDVGLPGLLAVAALLIVVIFLARRLRQTV